jgi:hypothetical protein
MKPKRYIQISDNEKRKQKGERAVFRRFARSGGTVPSILMDSIASRRPPQPDIYCVDSCHVAHRFELCELADSIMKQAGTDSRLTLESLVQANYLDQHVLELLDAKYDRCYVNISRPTKNIRIVLSAIARHLLRSDVHVPDAGASTLIIKVRDIPGTLLERGLVQIHAQMPLLQDPGARWQVNSGGSFGDCICEAIGKKVSRSYSLRGETVEPHLLLYYNGDPPYMRAFACESHVECMRPQWEKKFRDVWVFDAKSLVLVLYAMAENVLATQVDGLVQKARHSNLPCGMA